MSGINFHTREISVKIVFWGPSRSGKTTSLQKIHASLPPASRSQIEVRATAVDSAQQFDFLPVTADRIGEFDVRMYLHTVPGQGSDHSTRAVVLGGVDGIIFVADSQTQRHGDNLESLRHLRDSLAQQGLDLTQVPLVMQFNKRDLVDIDTLDAMNRAYNPMHVPVFGTVATTGVGVFDALRSISRLVTRDMMRNGCAAE